MLEDCLPFVNKLAHIEVNERSYIPPLPTSADLEEKTVAAARQDLMARAAELLELLTPHYAQCGQEFQPDMGKITASINDLPDEQVPRPDQAWRQTVNTLCLSVPCLTKPQLP